MKHCKPGRAISIRTFTAVCYCLVAALLLTPTEASTDSSSGSTASATCSNSLNLGLDYFLRTQLFANLTKVELPDQIPLPVSAFKIVNLKLAGLNDVSRGCSLQLSQADEARLRLRACARAAKIRISFMLRAGSLPVDFVQAWIMDTGISAQAVAHMVPGGRISLEEFDITLGSVEVENTGVTGTIITRVMRMDSVRKRLRQVIVDQATKKIREALEQNPLPR